MSTENALPTTPGYYLDNAGDVWSIREPGGDLRWLGEPDHLNPESWKPFTRLVPLRKGDIIRLLAWGQAYDDEEGYDPEDVDLEKRLTGE